METFDRSRAARRLRRVVVLGTGTGVGKTYVTLSLARALHERAPAAAVLALKPIETGLAPPLFGDAAALNSVSFGSSLPEPHPLYAMAEAISPHLAARHQGVTIELSRVKAWVEESEARAERGGWCLVETAGGAFSPLSPAATNVDLALALEPAGWVLVIPDALGALHDTRATLIALAHVARLPDFLVVSAARAADLATGSTANELRLLGIGDAIACLGRDDKDGIGALADALSEGARSDDAP